MPVTVTLKRNELYEQVWARPMTHIAKDLQVSPPTLAKACTTMNIPRPKQGHWTLRDMGREPEKAALPALTDGVVEEVEVRKAGQQRVGRPKPTDTAEEPRVAVRQPPATEVAAVTRTRKALLRAKPDSERGTVSPRGRVLSVVVGPELIERALGIMAAVLATADANGWPVRITKRPERSSKGYFRKGPFLAYATAITVDAVELEMSIAEKVRMTKRPLTPEEKASSRVRFWLAKEVREYHLTGKLEFYIHGIEGTGGRQRWADSPTKRLEAEIGSIAEGLAAAAALHKQRLEDRRLENARREERRRQLEEERERLLDEERRAEEKARRLEELVALADAHESALRIRRMCAAMKARPDLTPAKAAWCEWAISAADDLDPVVGPGPPMSS